MKALEINIKEFSNEIDILLKRTKKELPSFKATRFRQMIIEHGYVKASELVTQKEYALEGFTVLLLAGREDLSVETLVLHPEYKRLFSKEAIKNSELRLKWDSSKEYKQQNFNNKKR